MAASQTSSLKLPVFIGAIHSPWKDQNNKTRESAFLSQLSEALLWSCASADPDDWGNNEN